MKRDGRKLSHETLEAIRCMAVRRVHEGEKASAVIESYGMHRTVIYRWLKAEKKQGEKALKARQHPGRQPLLTAAEKKKIQKWICGKDPRQHGFLVGLWTRKVVQRMILDRFGKRLSITSVGRVLWELGITPQKPLRRAYERDPVAIAKWTQEEYPALKRRARERNAEIFFLDEAGVRSDAPLQRSWGAKGQTPVVATSSQRQAVNAISAVNALGAFWYAVYSGSFNATRFVEFLGDFMKGRRKPVMLVVDRHPSHRASMVVEHIARLEGKLELHFLPGYAPELNPDEFVWNNLRQNGVTKIPLRKGESLRERVTNDLAKIKSDRSLVRSFFMAPSVAYTLN